MRRTLIVVPLLLLLLGIMTRTALAQQPPPPHDHLLTVPGTGEQVQVAPDRCELGDKLQGAFLNFHFNVHVGEPMEQGITITPDFFCPTSFSDLTTYRGSQAERNRPSHRAWRAVIDSGDSQRTSFS